MTDLGVAMSQHSPVFEELTAGDELTPLVRGPMTPVHLMRWSAAIENWHRIHYDVPFATRHDGLPGLLINGSWKQHFLVQMVREWLGPDGWLARISFQFRKMNLVGETLTAHGTVTDTYERHGLGFVVCEVGIRNDADEESTPGSALGVLPLRSGKPVPYPFPELDLDER
jgi:acyl dehydratase